MSLLSHFHEESRPWGSFEQFTQNEATTVKIIRVAANERLSLQKHAHRSEYWKVISGSGSAQTGDTVRDIAEGDQVEVPVGTLHRLSGGTGGITVLEIAFGDFDENDIERVEDDFGRTGTGSLAAS